MKTQQSVPICNKHFTDYLNNPNVNSIFIDLVDDFFIDLVDDNEVVNIVNTFKPKMSSGHDGMPVTGMGFGVFQSKHKNCLTTWFISNVESASCGAALIPAMVIHM